MPLKNGKLTYLFEVEAKKENLIPNMLRRGRPADSLPREADILPGMAGAERTPLKTFFSGAAAINPRHI